MNRFIIIVVGFIFATIASAQDKVQDLIITESGETIKACNIEISSNAIFYQTSDAADSNIHRISLSDVMLIKYADGRKWMPGQADNTGSNTKKTPDNNISVSYADDAANKAAIAKASPDKVSYIGEGDGKVASEILMLFAPTADALLADQNLEIAVRTQNPEKGYDSKLHYNFTNRPIDIFLTNRSDRTIYIDLGDTYLINNGESMKYYTPGAVSNSKTTGVGAGVGIGIFSVGAMQSNTQSITTFAERILPIPPGVTKVLVSGKFSPFGKIKDTGLDYGKKGGYNDLTLLRSQNKLLNNGDSTSDFDGVKIPAVTAITTYSFNESMTNPVQLKATYEPAIMIGSKMGKFMDVSFIRAKEFSPNFTDCLYLFFRQDKKK